MLRIHKYGLSFTRQSVLCPSRRLLDAEQREPEEDKYSVHFGEQSKCCDESNACIFRGVRAEGMDERQRLECYGHADLSKSKRSL